MSKAKVSEKKQQQPGSKIVVKDLFDNFKVIVCRKTVLVEDDCYMEYTPVAKAIIQRYGHGANSGRYISLPKVVRIPKAELARLVRELEDKMKPKKFSMDREPQGRRE